MSNLDAYEPPDDLKLDADDPERTLIVTVHKDTHEIVYQDETEDRVKVVVRPKVN